MWQPIRAQHASASPLTQKSQAAARPRPVPRGGRIWQLGLLAWCCGRCIKQCEVVAVGSPREACGVRGSGAGDLGVLSTGAGEDRTPLDHASQGLELSCVHLCLGLDRPVPRPDPHWFLGLVPMLLCVCVSGSYLSLCLDLVLSSRCSGSISQALFPALPLPKPGAYPSSCLALALLVPGPPPACLPVSVSEPGPYLSMTKHVIAFLPVSLPAAVSNPLSITGFPTCLPVPTH